MDKEPSLVPTFDLNYAGIFVAAAFGVLVVLGVPFGLLMRAAGRRGGGAVSEDEDYEPEIFFGFGSMLDLAESQGTRPRLYGLRSVSEAAMWSMHSEPKQKRRRVGFRIPKAR